MNQNRLQQKKCFLFDIDGTIAVEDTLYEGSLALLQEITARGGVSCFITNNSTKSNADYVKKFAKWNIETSEDQFVTAGYMTQLFLEKNYKDKLIFVCGTRSYLKSLQDAGLLVTEEVRNDVAAVLVAYDSEINYEKLCRTSEILSTMDVPFYATNPDLVCPCKFGFIPDCGSICQMITNATGKTPTYIGKPNREVVDLCLERFGFTPEETIVVGDRLYTDIACGINAGVDTCAVLTGETTPAEISTSQWQPTLTFATVQDLLTQYTTCPTKQPLTM